MKTNMNNEMWIEVDHTTKIVSVQNAEIWDIREIFLLTCDFVTKFMLILAVNPECFKMAEGWLLDINGSLYGGMIDLCMLKYGRNHDKEDEIRRLEKVIVKMTMERFND